MAVSAAGYGLTLEKMMNNGAAINIEAEDMKVGLVTDSTTPDFNADDFYADIDAEIGSGGGYTTGGNTLTGTEITVAAGTLTFDATDAAWAASTITNAMGTFIYADAVTDELIVMNDFLTAVSTTGGTLTVAWHSSGILTVDFTP